MTLSVEALADIQDIEDFIAGDSIEAAHRTVDAGRARPDVHADIRSWPIQSYVVFYRIRFKQVEIVRILHGNRDVQTAFLP